MFIGLWLNAGDGNSQLLPGGFDGADTTSRLGGSPSTQTVLDRRGWQNGSPPVPVRATQRCFIHLQQAHSPSLGCQSSRAAGAYTYFASEAVSYGANPANWLELAAWARQHGRLFIPSVGPGYDDSRIRRGLFGGPDGLTACRWGCPCLHATVCICCALPQLSCRAQTQAPPTACDFPPLYSSIEQALERGSNAVARGRRALSPLVAGCPGCAAGGGQHHQLQRMGCVGPGRSLARGWDLGACPHTALAKPTQRSLPWQLWL